jgi:Dynamin family
MTEGQDAAGAPKQWGAGIPTAGPGLPLATADIAVPSVARGAGFSGAPVPAAPLPSAAPAPAFAASAPAAPASAPRTGPDGPTSAPPGGNGQPGDAQEAPETHSGHGWPGGQRPPADGRRASGAQSGVGWPATQARQAATSAGQSSAGQRPADGTQEQDPGEFEPFVRVDARKLEAALLGLRHPIVTVPLPLETPGVAAARAERYKLLSQIDDYLLPRLRQSGAPILVAMVGSTGAGKSTLVNSLVGKQVSATGIRRPTTNSPVLACHPDDMQWFAENVFLPTLPRVRQQGLAMPGRDGLLVLAACEEMPQGVALLDTPDIDSVVQAHRDFAHQFLDASDLWLFMTTARRYADAAVWEMLKDARDRGAALAIALSRVPPSAALELAAHFDAMLEANGLREVRRFIIPETMVTDDKLPTGVAAPVRDWLSDTARREDRRVAVLTQTMSGVLDTFRVRIPALADQVRAQLVVRRELQNLVDTAYAAGLTEFDEATRTGSLLSGEVLARWQDFAGKGDLLRALQVRRKGGGQGGKPRNQRLPARAAALKSALAASLESLVVAVTNRAAEQAVAGWQRHPAGAALLSGLGAQPGQRVDGESAPSEADYLAAALADLGIATRAYPAGEVADAEALARASGALAAVAARAVGNWQEDVLHLVQAEKVTKRSIARVVTFDDESLALTLSIAVLASSQPDLQPADGAGAVPQELLTALFGAGLLRDIGTRIRLDLHERVALLLEEEARRFAGVLDAHEVPDGMTATELLQAGFTLESVR